MREDAQEVMELVGEAGLEGLVSFYGRMTQEEIVEQLGEMFPQETPHDDLASRIYAVCENADWLFE